MQNSAPNSKKCSKGAQRNRERPNCQPMFGKMSPHSSSLRVGSKTWPRRRGKSSLRKPYSSKTFSWKNTHYIHCDPQIQTAVFSVYFVKNSSRAPGGGGGGHSLWWQIRGGSARKGVGISAQWSHGKLQRDLSCLLKSVFQRHNFPVDTTKALGKFYNTFGILAHYRIKHDSCGRNLSHL